MPVKWKNEHKRFVAGVLLAAFLSVFIVKGFHTHRDDVGGCTHLCASHGSQEKNTTDENPAGQEHQHHDHCLVCNFLFSPFIASTQAGNTPAEIILPIYYADTVQDVIQPAGYTFNLRAPPSFS